jgi:hypothetical protein
MKNYVALISDATGRYAFVWVVAKSWDDAIEQLEDVGCEVVEDQTDEYESEDFESEEAMAELGVYTITALVASPDFIAHN